MSDIALALAQHSVELSLDARQQRTLSYNGTSLGFQRANLAQCSKSKVMPTPELTDQTLDGAFQVSLLQSSSRIFNCRFPAASH